MNRAVGRRMVFVICAVLFVFLLPFGSVVAETCAPQPTRQLTQATAAEGGYLVLRRFPEDQKPFLIQEDCITITAANFWPKGQRSRYLYLGVVNYVPSEEEPDVSFIGVQVSRINPGNTGSDLIRVFRPAGWVRQNNQRSETLKKIAGNKVPLTVAEWSKLHLSTSDDWSVADGPMRLKWHAQPAEEVPSSWELRQNWSSPQTFQGGTFLTNLLLRFTVNRDDQHVSVVPFEVGLPADAQEMIISVHSNIDALRKTVRLRFQ